MTTSVSFNNLPPKYEKLKKKTITELNEDELEDHIENNKHKANYKNQFRENLEYIKKQSNALNKEISPNDWDNLDKSEGPYFNYNHELDLQTGNELQANLNALTNRENNISENNKKRKLGIWGGKSKKKSQKNKKKKSKSNKKKSKSNKKKRKGK
jgi:hypothetical protein